VLNDEIDMLKYRLKATKSSEDIDFKL